MKRRLFLTGPMGCGKSTAIEQALGPKLACCGGFRTRRIRDAQGNAVQFYLESPDGSQKAVFLDVSTGKPELSIEVFSQAGALLQEGEFLILDEIGGIELLCPAFREALDAALHSGIPILGVMKGPGPAGAMVKKLELSAEYEMAAGRLRRWLEEDEDTLLYECGQFDEQALILAKQWVEEYAHA